MRNLLNPRWLIIVTIIPLIVLLLLFYREYVIIETLLDKKNLNYWYVYGIILLAFIILNSVYAIYLEIQKKNISYVFSIISYLIYIPFIFLYFRDLYHIFPSSIPRWMITDIVTIYPGTFIMPTLAYSLLIFVVRFTVIDENQKAWKSFGLTVLIPILGYIFSQLGIPLWKIFGWKNSEHFIIIILVVGTVLFVYFFVRAIYIIISRNNKEWSKRQLLWKVPFALIFPIIGLLLNNHLFNNWSSSSGVFGNFSSVWFYIIAILNGILICLPNKNKEKYRHWLFIGRGITFSYTFYFFLVFLPFIPISILAIIFFGLGLVLLAPSVLFIVHVSELFNDFTYLKNYYSKRVLYSSIIVSFMILPLIMTLSFYKDKYVLLTALEYINEPDYSKEYSLNHKLLDRTINAIDKHRSRHNDILFGSQIPFITSIYQMIVFENKTISDSILRKIKSIFFDEEFSKKRNEIQDKDYRVIISGLEVSESYYDKKEKVWISWIDFKLTNNTEARRLEYSTIFDLPEGCWIGDYYLDIEDKREKGILAEKKAAMWVYSKIRNYRRDPGILYYQSSNRVVFRVYPFGMRETRTTGIKFIHKEPMTLIFDDKKVEIGKEYTNIRYSSDGNKINGTIYVSSMEKSRLEKIKRTPIYHFIIDASESEAEDLESRIEDIEVFLEDHPLEGNHEIMLTNSSINKFVIKEGWQNRVRQGKKEGGFFLERALQNIFYEEYLSDDDKYPVIIVVTHNMKGAILNKNLSGFKMAFPESDYFYHLEDNQIFRHSLIKMPKKGIDSGSLDLGKEVLTFTDSKNNHVYYLRNDDLPSILLDLSKREEGLLTQDKSLWASALGMQGMWYRQVFFPKKSKNEWLGLVKSSFESGIMMPVTSYLALENEAQKAMLERKQNQVLSGNKLYDLGGEIEQMSEPRLFILIIIFIVFLLIKKRNLIKYIRIV